ncbi:MAG: VOC family protein [Paracoccaceae bacterium]|nr:VOC family protein [Paracoccaceae bacterium]MDG1368910.1 VOC family protein [Paracoccaceae bacterium]
MTAPSVAGLNHVTLAVRDLAISFAFYRDALGFTPRARWSKGAYLSSGDLWLALIAAPERQAAATDYSHFALTVSTQDFEPVRARSIVANVSEWSENRSEGASYYFCDPDGHQLEIHVGDIRSKLARMRSDPWEPIEFFDEPDH